MSRFRKHIFICNNERSADNPKGCCSRAGSPVLLDYIKKRVHDLGLKGIVRVNKAGCLDACKYGPSMVVYPDETWYAPRTTEDMEEILQEHVQNNRIVDRLVIQFEKK
jgi:(2Fe-2S) ferredoxin